MFEYMYCVECIKTSTTMRNHERTYFSKITDAKNIEKAIVEVLQDVKVNWYWDSYLISFKITRFTTTKHFHWGSKVIFYWRNPDLF